MLKDTFFLCKIFFEYVRYYAIYVMLYTLIIIDAVINVILERVLRPYIFNNLTSFAILASVGQPILITARI